MVNGFYQFNNLGQQFGAMGTMSRFSGLLNTGSSYSIGNFLGGCGWGGFSGFGGFGNYNFFGGCGCGMNVNPWANIGFNIANSFTTIFGSLGLAALMNKVSSPRAEVKQQVKPETLETVSEDLVSKLTTLGQQDKFPDKLDSINFDNLHASDAAVTAAQAKIDEAKARVEGENGLNVITTSLKANIARRDELVAKGTSATDAEKTELANLKTTIKEQQELKKELEALKASYEEGGKLYNQHKAAKEKYEKEEATIKTTITEAKQLIAKYKELKTKADDEARIKQQAEQDALKAKANKEAQAKLKAEEAEAAKQAKAAAKAEKEQAEKDAKILNRADGTQLSRKGKDISDIYDIENNDYAEGYGSSKITMGHMQDLLHKYSEEKDVNKKRQYIEAFATILASNPEGLSDSEKKTLKTVLPQMKAFVEKNPEA